MQRITLRRASRGSDSQVKALVSVSGHWSSFPCLPVALDEAVHAV
jgi:hypothetical protein